MRLKLSEDIVKINLPGKKQVYRLRKDDGKFYGGDAVALAEEDKEEIQVMHHPSDPIQSLRLNRFDKEPLLHKVIENGDRITAPKKTSEIAEYSRKRLNKLPEEFKRFENPHVYKIGLSENLKETRDRLVDRMKAEVESR